MIWPIWSDLEPRVSTVLAVERTRSAIRLITFTVSSTTWAPMRAASLALAESSAALWQLRAISEEVADISSQAVAMVLACAASSSVLVAIWAEVECIWTAAEETERLLSESFLIIPDSFSPIRFISLPSMPISSAEVIEERAVRSPPAIADIVSKTFASERVMPLAITMQTMIDRAIAHRMMSVLMKICFFEDSSAILKCSWLCLMLNAFKVLIDSAGLLYRGATFSDPKETAAESAAWSCVLCAAKSISASLEPCTA